MTNTTRHPNTIQSAQHTHRQPNTPRHPELDSDLTTFANEMLNQVQHDKRTPSSQHTPVIPNSIRDLTTFANEMLNQVQHDKMTKYNKQIDHKQKVVYINILWKQ